MSRVLAPAALAAVLLSFAATARGAEPIGDGVDQAANPFPRLVLDSGRVPPDVPELDTYKAFLRGEYQLRYQLQRSFLLEATTSARAAQPGLTDQSLGQNQLVYHWLRLTPRFQISESLEIVGQADLTGLVLGDKARDVSADATPRDDYNGFSNVQPRWLYVQYKLPGALIRVGQQPTHWGMGIFFNDGNHPLLFGDYRYGQMSERILFTTTPAGEGSPYHLALAADLVYRDNQAQLTQGDHAFQGVVAAYYERELDALGVYSTLRHQERDRTSGSPLFGFADRTDTVAVDLHGKIVRPVPGEDAYFFGEAETTMVLGSTNAIRTPAQALAGDRTNIAAWGGAASLGFVHVGQAAAYTRGSSGDLVAQLEVGYASGDANPFDGTDKRFTFDPNHRIGLLMFDEVLRFQTARAATAAQDPLLTGAPPPGVAGLPSNGAVFAAQYINPTVVVRPRSWLDLKGGMVIAQSTSDVVDPTRTAISGSFVNYRGGNPKNKDLGVELDLGTEARIPLDYGLRLQVGAQAGVLFPGDALADANGVPLPTQWIAIGRLGVQF
jgi:hypothetical protein